jgi:hypothetical protein
MEILKIKMVDDQMMVTDLMGLVSKEIVQVKIKQVVAVPVIIVLVPVKVMIVAVKVMIVAKVIIYISQ